MSTTSPTPDSLATAAKYCLPPPMPADLELWHVEQLVWGGVLADPVELEQLLTDESYDSAVLWGKVCRALRPWFLMEPNTNETGDPVAKKAVREFREKLIDSVRTVLIWRADLNLVLPPDLEKVVWTVRVSPLAYLRAMGNLFWSAIRHPLSETTIDLSTGRVLYRT